MVCCCYFRHHGCDCPPEFEGSHCEYKIGTAPEWDNDTFFGASQDGSDFPKETNSVTETPGMSNSTIAMIVLMAIGASAAMVAVIAFVIHTNYNNFLGHALEPEEEHAREASSTKMSEYPTRDNCFKVKRASLDFRTLRKEIEKKKSYKKWTSMADSDII